MTIPGADQPMSMRANSAERSPLRLLRLLRLCRKELREILRDRRTIVTLVLMPLLAYPLLSMAFQRVLVTAEPGSGPIRCLVGLDDQEAALHLERYLAVGQLLLNQQRDPDAPPSDAPELSVEYVMVENLERAVADGTIDVGLQISRRGRRPIQGLGPPIDAELLLRSNSTRSSRGADFLIDRLNVVNRTYVRDLVLDLRKRLSEADFSPPMPVDYKKTFVEADVDDFSLTTFVPLILILMTITGAVYPAIDSTAGERERGTLETLMAAPVPRFGLLFAKYVAVVTVAMLTATANLVAMSVTLLATGMGPLVFGPEGPTLALIDQVFVLLMLFAAFFSAILLALTSFARSFKEAQSYLIPLMLVTLAPGIMSLMPDLEFSGLLAVVPLVNIVLLARDLLEGNVDATLAAAAVLSTLFYAAAAIALAARIFGTDAILYGSQATWTDLFRRPDRSDETPTVTGTMFCLAVTYPAYFLLANSLYRLPGATMTTRLLASAAVTVLLFIGLPLMAAYLQRTRFKTTFQLTPAPLLAWIAAFLLGISLWPVAHEIFLFNEILGLKSLGAEQIESVERMLEAWRALPPWLILLAMALTPAVCEEFFFRGYLMAAFRRSLPGWVAILGTAVLFGVFHVITTSVLATERFLPSTFLGLMLGWLCLRTGSVLPGMLLHAVHNGFLLMVAYYRDALLARGWGIEEQAHMPPAWLAAAGVGITVAIVLTVVATRRSRSPRPQ